MMEYDEYIVHVRKNESKKFLHLRTFDGMKDLDAERKAYEAAREWLNEHWGPEGKDWSYEYGNLDRGEYEGQFQAPRGFGGLVPAYVVHRSSEIERQLQIREEERRKERERRAALFPDYIAYTIHPELVDEYLKYHESNSKDGYSFGVIEFAKRWGWLMETRMERGEALEEIASKCSSEADIGGITGFMYGAAAQELSRFWIYGEQLRKWHNAQYGVTEGEGVVNPAILTIKEK